MIAVMLLLMVSGIGLAQAVSDPAQVTLRWLRLGGLIAVSLLAVAATVLILTGEEPATVLLYTGAALLPVGGQLIAVQLARRQVQRICAVLTFWLIAEYAALVLHAAADLPYTWPMVLTLLLSAGLMGGYLMTMLLGHAYLTSGNDMTQRPFARLVIVLASLLVLRALASGSLGLWPWWSEAGTQTPFDAPATSRLWFTVMLSARYAVGLLMPGLFTYMVWDCVRRRSNQSATGILYVATVLVLLGEGIALGLIADSGRFF